MLVREAKWFGARLQEYNPTELFPMLNVGSQTEDFRKVGQPWIDKYVFGPMRKAGHTVIHTDVRAAPGVDIVGDLLDSHFREELRSRRFRSVVFSNVLEHVSAREAISECVAEVVEPGGYLFVSVPYRFPYHPDPIDTLYRPNVEELASLFPTTEIDRSDILCCGNLTTYILARMLPNPWAFLSRIVQDPGVEREAPPCRPPSRLAMLPWLIRPFYATCVVLRKHANTSNTLDLRAEAEACTR